MLKERLLGKSYQRN